MRIKGITVGASRTVNLGNYESVKVEGLCTVEIENGDDIALARAAAIDEVKTQMSQIFATVQPAKK